MTFSMNVFTTYNVYQKWILGSAMCKAWLSVDYTANNASVMNLPVICVDRYLAITKPVKYKRWCTPTRAAIAIFFVIRRLKQFGRKHLPINLTVQLQDLLKQQV